MNVSAPQAAATLYGVIDLIENVESPTTVTDIAAFIRNQMSLHRSENKEDPLLGGNVEDALDALVIDAVVHTDINDMTTTMKRLFWSETKIEPSKDLDDWETLDEDEKRVLKFIFGFFAIADQLVNNNIVTIYMQRLVRHEFQSFFVEQMRNETVHKLAYNMLIRTFITDPDEEQMIVHAYKTLPSVRGLTEWITRWMNDPKVRFTDQVVAQIAFEGIFFAAAFACIFRLQSKNLMSQTVLANQWIRRDESLHAQFYIAIWKKLKYPASEQRVHEIFHSAYMAMAVFVEAMLPGDGLPGLDAMMLKQHVQSTVNMWLVLYMNLSPLYKDENGAAVETPLPYTKLNDVPDMVNFFERFNTSYQIDVGQKEIVNW